MDQCLHSLEIERKWPFMPPIDLFFAREYSIKNCKMTHPSFLDLCAALWFISRSRIRMCHHLVYQFLGKTEWNIKLSNRFGIKDCENRNLVHSNEGIPCNNQGSLMKFYGKMPACTFVPTCNLLAKAADVCATIMISIC